METLFPVVFFDGERETSIGNVAVHPATDYKTLQSILSLKIGISPNQFSVYLVNGVTSRKIPVTAKSNFAAICWERDCCLLVVLKRSRDSRARRQRRKPSEQQQQPAGNVMLLKRNNDVKVNNAIMSNNNDHNVLNGVCEECERAKQTGREAGFHWCVYDPVTFGFRSPAGPIARPVKRFP